MRRLNWYPVAPAATIILVIALLAILSFTSLHERHEPREPEWLDVGHGIYQACTDTGRSLLKDSASGGVVLDRDDTACEAVG